MRETIVLFGKKSMQKKECGGTSSLKSLQEKMKSETNIPWRLLIGLAPVNLALVAIALIRPFGLTIYTYIYSGVAVLCPLLFAFICLKDLPGIIGRFRRFTPATRPGRRFSSLLIAVDLLVFALSQAIFLLYFIFMHTEAPFPSLPYFLESGVYPFLIAAILLLPAGEVSLLARLRIFLDSLMIIIAVATFFYFFVLVPPLITTDGTQVEKVFGPISPSADLVVMFCLLLVTLRSGEPVLRPVLGMLGLALFVMFLVHTNRMIEVLNDGMRWIEPENIAWFPAVVFLVGAAQTLKNSLKKEHIAGSAVEAPTESASAFLSASRWKSWFSLILVLVVSMVIFMIRLRATEQILGGQIVILFVSGFIILLLLVLRQLLAMYEIGVLHGKLQRRNRSLRLLNDLLEKQATTDSLTGLPNHRELIARLDEALVHACQRASACAIIFMDIDYFKDINDCFGHLTGDTVLYEFSKLVLSEIRANDYLGRWGGEEFVAILPGVEPAEAFQVAERMRTRVERHTFASEQGVHLTCSLGIATYPYSSMRREDLLVDADRAMYAAKRLGRNQARTAFEPLVLVMGMLTEISDSVEETETLAVVESLVAALEARDRLTGLHSRQVAALSLRLALGLGVDWCNACVIGMGGLLHDLGKIAMPDTILFKHGRLSAAEVEYMGRHPLIGEKILTRLPSLSKVATIVRTHHERVDGSGYPDGLRGDCIPLGARIVAVADAYDAIISHRVYRQGRTPSEAAIELHKEAGVQFDPRVVEALDCLLATIPHFSTSSNSQISCRSKVS